jgi:O-antigen/teichoic acid export membrane protein
VSTLVGSSRRRRRARPGSRGTASGMHLESSAPLAGRTARGVAWVTSARLGSQLLQFIASLVLARLLTPSAYGLVAIVWTFTGFAFLFNDLGIGAALVQSKTITEADAATAFFINAAVGIGLTLVVLAFSGPLSALMHQPHVAGLLALASLGFTLSVTTVPTAILERRMKFSAVAAIDFGTMLLGLAVSVGAAALGAGAKSLVLGPLVTIAASSVLSFLVSGWVPRAMPTRESARKLFAFGKHVTGFNVINYWARNGDNLLLGRFVGAHELGFYSRAYMLMLMPVTQVTGVLGRVLLPVFSAMQDDPARLRSAVLRVSRASGVVFFPLVLGLAATAHNFVLVAFGEQWRGAIPLVAILAISAAPQIVGALSGLLGQAVGKTRLLSTWGNLSSLSTIAAILIGLPWGAEGVAIAFAARAYLGLPLNLATARLATGLGTGAFVRASSVPFAAALVMGVVVAALGAWLEPQLSIALCLAEQVLVGAAVYLFILNAAAPDALHEVVTLLRRGEAARA